MNETFSEQFNLHFSDCNDLLISDLKLSVRAQNCLKRANIIYVSDLLNYTQDTITTIRNLGSKAAKEINETLHYLSDKIYIRKLIQQYHEDILSGNFNFRNQYNLTNTQNKILDKYITACITLGPQLVKDCFSKSKTIDHLIYSLENYHIEIEKEKRYRELKFLTHNLNKSRSHSLAYPFITAYSSNKETFTTLCKLYSARNALLKDIDFETTSLDKEQYFLIKDFLYWCNTNFEELDIRLQNSLSHLTMIQLRILELYTLGHTLSEIAKHFNTTEEKISTIVDRIKFQPYTGYSCRRILSHIIKLEMAMQNTEYVLPLKILMKHYGHYSNISAGFHKIVGHFCDIIYLEKKKVFVLDYYQSSEENLI